MIYSAMWSVPSLTQEGYILIGLQNTVVESIQVSKSKLAARNKIKIPLPTPKNIKNIKKRTKEEAEAFFKSKQKTST